MRSCIWTQDVGRVGQGAGIDIKTSYPHRTRAPLNNFISRRHFYWIPVLKDASKCLQLLITYVSVLFDKTNYVFKNKSSFQYRLSVKYKIVLSDWRHQIEEDCTENTYVGRLHVSLAAALSKGRTDNTTSSIPAGILLKTILDHYRPDRIPVGPITI